VWKRLLLLAVLGFGFYTWWTNRPVAHGPGVVASAAPRQEGLSGARPFAHKDYTVTPLARFALEARVLGKEIYRAGREAELSPVDLALGWGPMSDEAVLDRIDISQSNRFYYWSVREFPIPQREIEVNSANMHMIPADGQVAKRLQDVRRGNVVKIRGYLVRVDAKDGWQWQSSLTRHDTGNGACELIWVEDVSVM
jgi:hypothetical protein